jgi:sugar/nucleoside kinase (ribokinase family)
VRPLGVIGLLSRDVVAGSPPQIGGGPWHAARALHALRHEAVIFAKCGNAEKQDFGRRLAGLGLPATLAAAGETTSFAFSYDGRGARTMQVDAVGERWLVDDVPLSLLRRVEWLHVAPLLRGDFDEDMLGWLARGARLLLDGQGLVRRRKAGRLVLDTAFDSGLLRHVSVLKLAEEEAAVIGDLAALGVAEIGVTAGPEGSRVITRDGETHVPARPVAGDPTGAGDAFAVAYIASRAEGHSPVSAARRATALVAALLARGPR